MKVWFDSVETILGLYQTKVGFTTWVYNVSGGQTGSLPVD